MVHHVTGICSEPIAPDQREGRWLPLDVDLQNAGSVLDPSAKFAELDHWPDELLLILGEPTSLEKDRNPIAHRR